MTKTFDSLDDAHQFLQELGASPKLLLHVKLVNEASELIINKLLQINVSFDVDFVRLGVAFHDAGKIIFPAEFSNKGNLHEAEGEKLLLENGIDEKLSRICQSHGKWQTMDCSLEEYLIALADKLWKGKRENLLESVVIDKVTEMLNQDRWEIFVALDSCFEKIASEGDSRLLRSQNIEYEVNCRTK